MSTQHAILVGLTEILPRDNGKGEMWNGKNGCAGCELDVDNVAKMLGPLGYELQTLKTPEATKYNILTSLNTAAQTLTAGDSLVFFFAGHGGQQPDLDGDETDHRDETLIVYDGHIIDDQLNEIWCKFDPDVRIIMLSDSCNSGTNYRNVRDVPTPTPIKPMDQRISGQMYAEMFHMGGCRDGGASAGYQSGGAFTQALVNAWGGGQFHGTYEELHSAVVQRVSSGQKPQYNWYGDVSEEFRNASALRVVERPVSASQQTSPVTTTIAPRISSDLSEDNQRLLIEAYMKLLDRVGAPTASRSRAATGRHLVCVHGISTHVRGYSNDWWDALNRHTDAFGAGHLDDTRHEVLWSNLVNSRSVGDGRAVGELKVRIQDVLDDRQRRQAAAAHDRTGARSSGQDRSSDLAWDDFLIYMTNAGIRQQIIDRFTGVVRALLAGGAKIDIISHSWGTVVAYEGLRELEADSSLVGQVANFFTVGSALSIPPVRGTLRPANKDGRRPSMVNRWINLDAQGDRVGGSLADQFDVDVEKLDLVPTGCNKNLDGLGWFDLRCAHASYFRRANVQVNRQIFGHFINS